MDAWVAMNDSGQILSITLDGDYATGMEKVQVPDDFPVDDALNYAITDSGVSYTGWESSMLKPLSGIVTSDKIAEIEEQITNLQLAMVEMYEGSI